MINESSHSKIVIFKEYLMKFFHQMLLEMTIE